MNHTEMIKEKVMEADKSSYYSYLSGKRSEKEKEPGVCGPEYPEGGKREVVTKDDYASPSAAMNMSTVTYGSEGREGQEADYEGNGGVKAETKPNDREEIVDMGEQAKASAEEMDRLRKRMEKATEDELRDVLKEIEGMDDGEGKRMALKAFDKECDKRSASYYENLNHGEWL